MRILVCGGRNYKNKERVFQVLDDLAKRHSRLYNPYDNWLPSDITIISGVAYGADSLAADWALNNWCDLEEFPADWKKHGQAAGPIRNQQMIDEGKPDLVVAFPGGRGTADMTAKAKGAGIPMIEIDYNENLRRELTPKQVTNVKGSGFENEEN